MTDLPEITGYRVEAEIGHGGMGVVYRAVEIALERPVALKVIADHRAEDPDYRRRFLREARAAAAVTHVHVVPVYAFGEDRDRLFLASQYVEGADMGALIKERGRLDPQLAITLVGHVADALDAAHEQGLVHRDVKPENVLVAAPDRRPHAYLSDFGLARAAATSHALTSAGWGTPGFMAPELHQEEHAAGSVRSDVYALGVTLYRALSGRYLPQGVPIGAPGATLTEFVPHRELALALDGILRRALAYQPAHRHASAGELAREVRAAIDAATRASAEPRAVPSVPSVPAAPSVPVGPAYAPAFTSPRAATPTPAPPAATVVPPVVPTPDRAAPVHLRPPAPDRPAPTPRRVRRPVLVAACVVAVAGAATFGLLSGAGTGTATTAPDEASITLQPVQDEGATVRLSWTGPDTLDYAVEVTAQGQGSSTVLAGRTTTMAVTVAPDVPYCFRITATDARSVLTSNAQPVRGATCAG